MFLFVAIALPGVSALALEPILTLAPNDVPEGFGNGFGWSVAISGDYIAVGAPFDPWYNGDATGAVYIFRRVGPRWIQQAKLVNPDPVFEAQFGLVVAMDGDVLAVAAPVWQGYYSCDLREQGAVYVFRRNDNGTPADFTDDHWEEEANLRATQVAHGVGLGTSLAVSRDIVVAGSDCSEAVAVFRRGVRGFWIHETSILFPGQGHAKFGWSVDVEERSPQPDDDERFLGNTLLPILAQRIIVGAPRHDELRRAAYTFLYLNGQWVIEDELVVDGEDVFGCGTSVAAISGSILVGCPGEGALGPTFKAGAVHVFTQSNGTGWGWESTLLAENPRYLGEFGSSIACDLDACLIAPNTSFDPNVHVLQNIDRKFRETAQLSTPSGPVSVALHGNYGVIWNRVYVMRNAKTLRDLAAFQNCYETTGLMAAPCQAFDLLVDGHVTLRDFGELCATLAGP